VPLVTVGRRITCDGFISYSANDYSVPDGLATLAAQGTQAARAVDVRATFTELRLFVDERLVATHPLLEGRGARRLTLGHRSSRLQRTPPTDGGGGVAGVPPPALTGLEVERRALSVYERVLQ